MSGWIKIHRKMLEWEWYKDRNTTSLFFHLLLRANHKDGRFMGHEIKRGQLVTGRKALSEETTLSERTIRTCLTKLKSTNELTIKSTSKFSIITICNYEKYQGEDSETNQQNDQQNDQRPTSIRPAFDQHSTTILECKNVRMKEEDNSKNKFVDQKKMEMGKKENSKKGKTFIPPTVEEVREYCISRQNGISPSKFCNFYESKGWLIGKSGMKDWKAAVRTWEIKNREESPQPAYQMPRN